MVKYRTTLTKLIGTDSISTRSLSLLVKWLEDKSTQTTQSL